jgi:hypothetical protein
MVAPVLNILDTTSYIHSAIYFIGMFRDITTAVTPTYMPRTHTQYQTRGTTLLKCPKYTLNIRRQKKYDYMK